MNFRPPYLTYDELRARTDQFLAQYNASGTIPVPIEEIVEFDLSMDVIPVDGIRATLGVDAFLSNDLEWIYVDEYVVNYAPARYRFSLAHEVAHYWLHDTVYQQCSIRSLGDWAVVQAAIGEEGYKSFE